MKEAWSTQDAPVDISIDTFLCCTKQGQRSDYRALRRGKSSTFVLQRGMRQIYRWHAQLRGRFSKVGFVFRIGWGLDFGESDDWKARVCSSWRSRKRHFWNNNNKVQLIQCLWVQTETGIRCIQTTVILCKPISPLNFYSTYLHRDSTQIIYNMGKYIMHAYSNYTYIIHKASVKEETCSRGWLQEIVNKHSFPSTLK